MGDWGMCRSPLFFFEQLAEITGGLNVEPELSALFKKLVEFEGHFGRNAAAAEHDFVDALRTDAKGSREGVLGNAHGHEIVFEKNFTGCDGGFHLENFAASRQLLINVVVILPLKQILRSGAAR
jgi:hypothetical protein